MRRDKAQRGATSNIPLELPRRPYEEPYKGYNIFNRAPYRTLRHEYFCMIIMETQVKQVRRDEARQGPTSNVIPGLLIGDPTRSPMKDIVYPIGLPGGPYCIHISTVYDHKGKNICSRLGATRRDEARRQISI